MSQYIQTKEDGSKFVYVASGQSEYIVPLKKETDTQIKTEHHKYNKKTGFEISSGSHYYRGQLLTAEEFKQRKNYSIERAVARNNREIEELMAKVKEIQTRNTELESKRIA